MRALILDDTARKKIARVTHYAVAHPLSLAQMMQADKTGQPLATKQHTCTIRDGYIVSYTIEQQPVGWCRHISISVDTPGTWPSEAAVNELLAAFGFRCTLRTATSAYTEPEAEAINVIELMRAATTATA